VFHVNTSASHWKLPITVQSERVLLKCQIQFNADSTFSIKDVLLVEFI